MARLTFRQGIVQHQTDTGGNPTFLQVSGGYVNLIVSPDYTIVAFVSGTTDYLHTETVSITDAWGPFTPPQDYWLYWDLNLISGVVTRGSTTLEPIEAPSAPVSPGIGQMWFNTVTNTWKAYNGSTFSEVVRVLACKLTNGTVPTSMSINTPDFRGTQVGLTTPKRVGSLVFDTVGKPLRTGTGNKFFTTEDAFVTGVPSSASLRVETITTQGEANAPIAAYQVVEFYDFNKIKPAEPFNQGLRAIGILEEDVVTNEVANFVTSGTIYNEAWDWDGAGASINDPVYYSLTGEIQLTEAIPNQLPVGVVLGPQEILFVPSLFPQIASVSSGVTDHALLTGLNVDDHTQYHNDARGDLRYLQLTGGTLSGNLLMDAGTDVIIPDLPVNPTDAANKQYVDQISAGLDFKDSVHMCTVANLPATYNNGTLGAGATLTATTPGVLPPSITDNHAHYVLNDRVLVKSQTDATQNGLFEITNLGAGENVTEIITTADVANSLDGTFFRFEDAVGAPGFYVWYDTPSAPSNPAQPGTGIQVSIPTGAFALQVTAATIDAINASPAAVTAYIDENNSLYIVDDATGVRTPAVDASTGFAISTTIAGTATPVAWELTRTQDADNTPTNEVSGGLFVFVEDGATCAGTGWVMTQPAGAAILGTDELVFTQFSAVPTVNPSRIQDLDNNTFVDVEQAADNNNVIMQAGPRDGANVGGDISLTSGSATNASGNNGGDIAIVTGSADPALDGGAGGSFAVTTGLAGQGGDTGVGGDISFETQDGTQNSGSISLYTGDATGAGNTPGAIDLRPGVGPAGAPSANVNIIGSPTGAAAVESGLKFIPKANIVSRFGIGFSSPAAVAADVIWKLPATDGSNGQVLTTDGSSALSWQNGGGAGQNLWETIVSDSGNAIANTITDSLSILGGTGIDTAIVGDVLTISAVPAPTGFALAFGTFNGEGDAFGTQYTSDNDITTWTASRPSHGLSFPTPSGAAYAPSINTWVHTIKSAIPNALYSTDDGVTWTAAPRVDFFNSAANGNTGTGLAWSEPLGLFIMGGNTGQIQKSSDGIVWSNSTDAPKTTGTFGSSQIHTTAWSDDLALFFVGTDNNQVGFSADGDTWTLTAAEPGGASTIDITGIYVVGSRIFVGRDNGTIYYSDNNGVTWNLSTLDVGIVGAFQPDLGFAANNDGSVIVMGGIGLNDAQSIWRSVDNGVNFTKIDAGTSAGVGTNMYAFCLIFDTDYGFIMGGRNAGLAEQIILTSTDGLTWTLRVSENSGVLGTPAETNDFRAIASKNQNGQTATAVVGDPDQNLWETIVSDSGSATADTVTDSLSILGGTGISTAIVGDVLTVSSTGGLPAAVTECNILVANNANTYVEQPIPELPRPYDIAMQVFGVVPDDAVVFKFVTPQAFVLLDYGHQGAATTTADIPDSVEDILNPAGAAGRLDTTFRLFINGVQKGNMGFHDSNTTGPAEAIFYSDVGNGWLNGNDGGLSFFGSFIDVAVGDIIEIKSPVTAAGIEDVAITLRGMIEPANPCGTIVLETGHDVALDETWAQSDLPLFGYSFAVGLDETNFNLNFSGGASHAISDIITLSNGTTVTVDNVSTGAVTEFTIATLGAAISPDIIYAQTGTTGVGTGFDLEVTVSNTTVLEQIPQSASWSEFAVLAATFGPFPPAALPNMVPFAVKFTAQGVNVDYDTGVNPPNSRGVREYHETNFENFITFMADGGSGRDVLVRQTIFGPGGIATVTGWISAGGF